jgi:hypothetical protein
MGIIPNQSAIMATPVSGELDQLNGTPPPSFSDAAYQPTRAIQQQVATQQSPAQSFRQQQEQRLMNSIESQEQAKPQPTGFWGKTAHILGNIGNAAGELILGDQNMQNISGTRQHAQAVHQATEGRLSQLQNQDVAEQDAASKRGLEGAEAAHAESEIATPEERAAKLEQEKALTQNETEGSSPDMATYRALTKMGMRPSEALQEIEKDKALALKPAGTKESLQQQLVQAQNSGDTATAAKLQKQLKDIDPMGEQRLAVTVGEQGDKNLWSVPQPDGSKKVVSLKPGDTIPNGALSLSGQNTINTPTQTQRTAAGRAQTVVEMAPSVLADIDRNAAGLGPVMGRWDKFMQGEVGAPDAAIAELRSNLMMMSSAVALAHAQGRLPENLRQEFDRAINSPKQSPENLKATISAILPWLQKMQELGRPNGAPQPQAGGELKITRDANGRIVGVQ